MTQYRQDPRLPWSGTGAAFVQPGAMRLVASYGFDRGKGIGPGFAPNSQGLPDGWTIWDLGNVLGAAPWVDAGRREACVMTHAREFATNDLKFSAAGILRPCPVLPDFWIYARCGLMSCAPPAPLPGDAGPIGYLCGLVISPQPDLPTTDGLFYMAGTTTILGPQDMQSIPGTTLWADHEQLTEIFNFVIYPSHFPWVRWHIQQGISVQAWFSADGEHWLSQGGPKPTPGPDFPIRWLGFLSSSFGSVTDPLVQTPAVASCERITVYETIGSIDQNLATQGAEPQL